MGCETGGVRGVEPFLALGGIPFGEEELRGARGRQAGSTELFQAVLSQCVSPRGDSESISERRWQSIKPRRGRSTPAFPRVTFQPEPLPDPSLLGSRGWHRVTGTGTCSISRRWLSLQEKWELSGAEQGRLAAPLRSGSFPCQLHLLLSIDLCQMGRCKCRIGC